MTTATKGRDSRNLLADDSGATMVMGVFMAMMVVGMIYYVWGLGGTIIYRERMQDAVDAGAFGASVYAAAGMNMIAFMNVIMAAFAVIGAALRMMHDFLWATTYSFPAGDVELCIACAATIIGDLVGACEVQCEEAATHVEEYSSAGWMTEMADLMDTFNRGIHIAQQAVSIGAFAGGELQAINADHYSPNPVSIGILVPGNVFDRPGRIQSEDDASNWACDRGSFPTYLFVYSPAVVLAHLGNAIFAEPPSAGWIEGEIYMMLNATDRARHYCNNGQLTFQRVPTSAWLGDQSFQNYVVDFHRGSLPYQWSQQGVQAANWGREGNSAPNVLGLNLSVVGELHRLSIADSEYYYEQTEDMAGQNPGLGPTLWPDPTPLGRHQEWLWHPAWRARMRRFHANTGILGRFGTSAINEVESVIVH
jgi:hypothetical protein